MKAVPRNTSVEEQAIRAAVSAWGRARWGDDVREIDELVLGRRRIDKVFVYPADIIGIEVKGPRDSMGDGRLPEQLHEFSFYLPEVWLIVDEKWREHPAVRRARNVCNVAVAARDGTIDVPKSLRNRRHAKRDDLCCSRLVERLWTTETMSVARRCTIPCEVVPGQLLPIPRVKSLIARMLTGHQVMREVCAQLRARPMTGMASDDPLRD